MPSTVMVPIVTKYSGIAETSTTFDAVNGMALPANDNKYFVHFSNTDAAADATVTVVAQAKYGGLALTNPTFVVTHDATLAHQEFAGPFDPAVFNDGGSNVQFTASFAGTAAKFYFCAVHLG